MRRETPPYAANPIRVGPVARWMALLALTAGLLGSAGNAKADPRSGAAVFGGIAVHQGNVKTVGGRASGFLSSGLDAGAEVQQVLGREWSVAGFAQTSAESVAGDAARTYSLASHGIVGGEARYWEGAKFVGVHLGAYSEALAAKSGSGAKDTQAVGWGLGLSWGWEGDSGWFAAGQLDLAEVAYTNAVHTLTGIRAHVGYRWKRE